MKPSRPNAGEALVLERRLDVSPDPLELYRTLTDGGRARDTLLFESADAADGKPARSILIPRAAVRATCRDRRVIVDALNENGLRALDGIAARLAGRAKEIERGRSRLVATFASPALDLEDGERLAAASPLDVLRAMSTAIPICGTCGSRSLLAAGVFAYDLVDVFQELPPARADELGYADFVFWLADSVITIDHTGGRTQIACAVFGGHDEANVEAGFHDASERLQALVRTCDAASPSDMIARGELPVRTDVCETSSDVDDEAFESIVRDMQTHIRAGDVFQVVPSRTFRSSCEAPFRAYAFLRALNPSPYMFYVAAHDHVLFGASPETAVRVGRDDGNDGRRHFLELQPIAGTRPRGRTAAGAVDVDADDRYEAALRLDRKELAEHVMLVDLARNDVARVSEPGTRRVSRMLGVERFSHVMHLVSTVRGVLREGLDALHAYQASLNMGTLVGAPKLRAAQILRGVERTKRGPYGGAVGYLTHAGELDTAIVIRSAVVREGIAHVRAGAGVVLESNPAAEAYETTQKAQAVLAALSMARAETERLKEVTA